MTSEDEEAVDLEYEEILKQTLSDLPQVPAIDDSVEVDNMPSVPSEEPSRKDATKEKTTKAKPVQLPA